MTINISAVLNSVNTSLMAYGYEGLFISSFLSALAIPIPAYIALAGMGALAAQGYFNIYVVLGVALIANVLADLTGYSLARKYGEETMKKLGFGRVLRSKPFHTFEKYINEFPQAIIFITRMITEAGPVVNVLSGLSRVPKRTFIIYDIIGEACYVLLFGLAGYFLGDAWKNNADFIYKGVAVLVTFGLMLGVLQFLNHRIKKSQRA